jgi:hypothetical protein
VLPKYGYCAARKIIVQSRDFGLMPGIADEFIQCAVLVVFGCFLFEQASFWAIGVAGNNP